MVVMTAAKFLLHLNITGLRSDCSVSTCGGEKQVHRFKDMCVFEALQANVSDGILTYEQQQQSQLYRHQL